MSEKKANKPTNSPLDPLSDLSLGQTVEYKQVYDASLLQPVPRRLNREPLGIYDDELPFSGVDQWTGYEVSWLNAKGKPQIAILKCCVPASSPNLIESKSFKLYLNSFNQTRFESTQKVLSVLGADLSKCAGESVNVELILPNDFQQMSVQKMTGICIDDLDISIDDYDYDASHLKTSTKKVSETLVSHLLKSNCLITNQPDWGSVMIRYTGNQIDQAGLLRYLISFRTHNEFHEQCVERIFSDIQKFCNTESLTVYARYTRRGGLDINPFRSSFEQPYPNERMARQ